MPDKCVDTVVLTVGNAMMGDDGAGPYLYQLLVEQPLAGWRAVDGGSMPENDVDSILALKPRRLFIVDATEMALEPGEVRILDEQMIADMFVMTTHNLPLTFLIERMKAAIDEVVFIGVQPDLVAFGMPMNEQVRQGVEKVFRHFCDWHRDDLRIDKNVDVDSAGAVVHCGVTES
jgi:hydrogenase 3 maturation protease